MQSTQPSEPRNVARIPFLIACGMAALTALTGLALWTILPDRFPTHFDLAGRPDRFADRSSLEFFLLPVLSLVLTALLLGITRWIGRLADAHPDWINVPNKERFLALAPAQRRLAMEPARIALSWIAVHLNGLFLYILIGTERVANGAWTTLPSWPVVIFVAVVLGTVVHLCIRAHRVVTALSLDGVSK